MRSDLPIGTVTFLFTDIEGSTRLLHDLGPEAYADALAEHRRVLRDVFAAHRGVEVDTQGDAFFVAFQTAPGAVAAAEAGQHVLDRGPIRVRMGLHTGTPTLTSEGYVGGDVHRGARIAALAHGGQVLLSDTTASLLPAECVTIDLGRHRLKDFDGPTRVVQLGRRSFPTLRTPGMVALPTPATPFLGRERELHEAISVVLDRDPAILTILGPGGTGKTRFALEFARLIAEDADGGTLFVAVAALRDSALLLPAIAEALGAESAGPAAIAARVGERRTHVLLDNLEQLLPDAAAPLAALADAAPQLRLVLTSREALRVSAETRFDLPPLASDEAVALFMERARSVHPHVEESATIVTLCERLDRLPLALELAAARTRLLAPEALLDRLGARLDLPAPRDADPRHATLRATIEWSYDLLSRDEQVLFAGLAVFRGGHTLEAAEAVCDAELETVVSLLDKSLLRRRVGSDGADRFWMLETIREFAGERLAALGAEDVLRRRQVSLLVELAEEAGAGALMDRRHLAWRFDLLEPETDNIRAVLSWAETSEPVLGLELAVALEEFWVVRAPEEGTSWLERLLRSAADAPASLRAHARRALGGTLDIVGDHDRAAPHYRESLGLYEELGDELHVTNLRFRVGANLVSRGRTVEAKPLLTDVLADFERLEHRAGEAQAIGLLGYVALVERDHEAAARKFTASAQIVRELDWAWWELNMLTNLAETERQLGQLDEATTHARRALELAVDLGDRSGAVFAAAELACHAALRGDGAAAGRVWGAIEAEVDLTPLGVWPAHRGQYESVLRQQVEGEEFEYEREQGRFLSLATAAGVAAPQTEP